MEEEIRNVNVLFKRDFNRLITIRNYYYKTIRRWLLDFRRKQYYINSVARWFNREIRKLNQKRESQIKDIRFKYANAKSTKNALLVGINYVGTNAELRGCVNDVMDLKDLLTTQYDYSNSNIVTLTDHKATKQNIMVQLTKLLQNGKSGDTLFFSFSGHGYFTPDLSGDEIDGKDELIISVDKYAIVDDELKSLLDTHLKENVTLIALFDNCHSGTILDLPYHYFKGEHETVHHSVYSDTKGTVICLSGCRDDQVAIESYFAGDFNGAMTFNFIQLLKDNSSLTWKACLEQLRGNLKHSKFTQIPQITCGKKMDLNTLPVTL